MARPDYDGNGIVNLMASIAVGLGGSARASYPLLSTLDVERLSSARNVVLLVIDGLGHEYVAAQSDGVLREHLHARMTSVFPATTAAAVTTFLTGVAPLQHAHTGWFTYFEEVDQVLAGLPFAERGSGKPLEHASVADLLDAPPLYPALPVSSFVVTPASIADSAFNKTFSRGASIVAYNTLEEMFDYTGAILTAPGRNYVYSYWPDFDRLAHAYGVESREVRRHYRSVDKAFADFMSHHRRSDTLVLVTADHGFIDSGADYCIRLEDYPELQGLLAQPLCGEPRAAFCYPRPEAGEAFATRAAADLGGAVEVRRSAELAAQGNFGSGAAHPHFARRIGEYTLLPAGRYSIKDRVDGERPYMQIGVHGGMSDAEMYVPLIVVDL